MLVFNLIYDFETFGRTLIVILLLFDVSRKLVHQLAGMAEALTVGLLREARNLIIRIRLRFKQIDWPPVLFNVLERVGVLVEVILVGVQ